MVEKKRTSPADDKAQKKPRGSGPAMSELAPPAASDPLGEKRALLEGTSFPIVGIGASAGGLEVLETFFAHMPPNSGMAFVVIQHLDASHKSMLPELIRRHTQMQLFSVEDGLAVEPNCIYIIPSNRDMTLQQGRLYLARPAAAHGLRLPIDIFFRSLAAAQAEKAIGIILSGAGSDGTLGLKAIKEAGGFMVQEPDSAKYDGMPHSATATGLADYILPLDQMPEQLLKYVSLAPFTDKARPVALLPEGVDALQKIFILLRTRTGHDFSLYKKNSVERRIERRMAVKQIEHIEAYVEYLQHNGAEVQALFKELLISVTAFFRDAGAFQALEQQVIPQLFENRRPDRPVRVWVPGCATGEEAYGLAILLQERMNALPQEFKVQLFATDIDAEALEKARQGVYPESIATDVSPERLQHFFSRVNGIYQVSEPVRKLVVFAVQSVIKDPPFSKLDLISCRNLLIYLEPELQRKVLSILYYALKPGGFLFLGTSETPVEMAPYFTALDRKWKIFKRPENGPERREMPDFVTPMWISPDPETAGPNKQPDTRSVIEKLILEQYVNPCMVINEQHEILFIYGRVGQYLELPAGEVGSWNVLRLVREELRMPLSTAIRQALAQKQAAVYEHVQLKLKNKTHALTLTVQPIMKPASLQDLLVVLFEERPLPVEVKPAETAPDASDQPDRRTAELEQELENTKEYLQATIEELESSNEEIKSMNEELQSANEELEPLRKKPNLLTRSW